MSITSLMRPGRAVITATRSPSRIASSIEWVMNTDRKSTRLNSSHDQISYAVFCLKKKKKHKLLIYEAKTKPMNCRYDPVLYPVSSFIQRSIVLSDSLYRKSERCTHVKLNTGHAT